MVSVAVSVAEQVSRALCAKYPQAEGKIDVIDIATPLTYERYTGAWHGGWMSFIRPGAKMGRGLPGESQSVAGLFFGGQRLLPPGGLPGALMSGRTAAQLVHRHFGAVWG